MAEGTFLRARYSVPSPAIPYTIERQTWRTPTHLSLPSQLIWRVQMHTDQAPAVHNWLKGRISTRPRRIHVTRVARNFKLGSPIEARTASRKGQRPNLAWQPPPPVATVMASSAEPAHCQHRGVSAATVSA
ncbi:uncharacterized protein FIBRA_09139 [Fibroporia radiculosa]|uniref:Uncharacterized protein n=1 Tax=Fibroporia radiculosa TaxID=599839 RepID=J4ICQ8_9APHY|nr:uncharacterized protein FIBRA_09139 [Fibroporia radiculosa]CCM06836.1 predicted protein [Fibroporia radiculosa]